MQPTHNKLTLEVNAIESKAVIVAKSEDNKSRYIDITLVCNGESISVGNSDRTVLMAKDANTNNTIASVDCTVSGGVIIAELKNTLLAVPGQLRCEIVVYGTSGSVLTSAYFNVIVTERIDGTIVERENDFSALVSALSDVASTSNRIDEVAARIQPVSLGGTGTSDEISAAQNMKLHSLSTGLEITANSDLDSYITPGTYHAVRDAAATLLHCPVNVGFKLIVSSQQYSNYLVQILSVPTKNEIWFRGSTAANTYGNWVKIYTTDNAIEERGSWNPEAESGTITVNWAKYTYNGTSISVTAKLRCGSDITTALTLNGLPILAKYPTAGSCVVAGSDISVIVNAANNSIDIVSPSSLSGKTITVSCTYGIYES